MKEENHSTLTQHKESHKFSSDALLLANFAPTQKVHSFVELGCGCGIISLEYLKRNPFSKGLGLDFDDELLASANSNANIYSMQDKVHFLNEDFALFPNANNKETLKYKNQTDLVITNPPWLLLGQGKLPKSDIKRKALFGDGKTYTLFFSAAKFFLKERGLLTFISIPQRMEDIFHALQVNGFLLKKMQNVHKNPTSNAIFTLFMAEYRGKSLEKSMPSAETVFPIFLEHKLESVVKI